MVNIVLLLVCLLLGVALRRVKTLPQDAHVTINTVILHAPLPAISLLSLPNLEWDLSLISLMLVAWIIIGAALLFFPFVGARLGWEKEVIGCLILTAGLGNTSFVGFPVIEALYGKEALKHAVLLDQPGSFLIVSSVGIWVATLYSSGKLPVTQLVKRILLFPPFVAFITAIILGALGWKAEGMTKEVLERIAATLTPLALISVGLQLKWNAIRDEMKFLSIGLGFKLIIAPFIIYVLYRMANIPYDIFKIAVTEAAMAPMITASILASSHNLHPRLAGMMVGVGVPISFLTLGVWYFFL